MRGLADKGEAVRMDLIFASDSKIDNSVGTVVDPIDYVVDFVWAGHVSRGIDVML